MAAGTRILVSIFALSLTAHAADLIIPQNISVSGVTSNWTYSGCYTDSVASRSLNGAGFTDASMTDESCVAYCAKNNWNFAATEYSNECCE